MRDNRATVVWSTRENLAGRVEYSTDQKFNQSVPSRVRAFPPSETGLSQTFYQHQADLTGLSAGTEYFYRVIMSDGTNLSTEPDHRFRTAGPGPMTFLVFGDSGSGSADQQNMTKALIKERPDFIVHVGDAAYEEGTYDQFQANYFEYYRPIMRRAPIFPTPGNHEYITQRAAPYLNLHSVPAESVPDVDRGRYYSFDWGAIHFVSLDSNLLDDGIAASRMLKWLDQDLQNATAPWRVAFFHHLPYPLEHHLDDPFCAHAHDMLVPKLEKYQVQLVFTGHEHVYERTRPLSRDKSMSSGRGTVYITTGGAGGQGHAAPPRDFVARSVAAYHYLKVDADETRITVNAIDKDGKVFDTSVLTIPSMRSSDAVVNGASFTSAIAPGGIVSIFGRGLATESMTASMAPLPTALNGTTVTVNDEPAPLYFVSPSQINAQLRMDQQGPVLLRVTTTSGSAEVPLNIAEAAPGIFAGGVLHADGKPVTATSPAKRGEIVTVYASGLGNVSPRLDAGQVAPGDPLAYCMTPVMVQIGGFSVQPKFAGLAPSFVGLYQVNVEVPPSLMPGVYSLRLASRDNTSNSVDVPLSP